MSEILQRTHLRIVRAVLKEVEGLRLLGRPLVRAAGELVGPLLPGPWPQSA